MTISASNVPRRMAIVPVPATSCELDEKDRLFRPGQLVVDLGAAPGGWSQVAVERVGDKGGWSPAISWRWIPLPALTLFRATLPSIRCWMPILDMLGEPQADIVISDMAPNMSGMAAVDIPRAMDLVELALDMAQPGAAARRRLCHQGVSG